MTNLDSILKRIFFKVFVRCQRQCANMLLENAALEYKINWLSLTFNLMMSCTYVMFGSMSVELN